MSELRVAWLALLVVNSLQYASIEYETPQNEANDIKAALKPSAETTSVLQTVSSQSAPHESQGHDALVLPQPLQFLSEYGGPSETCNNILSEPGGSFSFLGLNRQSAMDATHKIFSLADQFGLSSAVAPVKGSLCQFLKLLPAAKPQLDSEKSLGVANLVQLSATASGQVQEETDVFVAIIYVMMMFFVLRGMYAKLWCDNFFLEERENFKDSPDTSDPARLAVDANYASLDWEMETLLGNAQKIIKRREAAAKKKTTSGSVEEEDGGEGSDGAKKSGLAQVKKLAQWSHEGDWPPENGDPWTAPVDPFDTMRDHHKPAVHYIRVYCQEWHYSIGWKFMTVLNRLFRSGIHTAKKYRKQANDATALPPKESLMGSGDGSKKHQ